MFALSERAVISQNNNLTPPDVFLHNTWTAYEEYMYPEEMSSVRLFEITTEGRYGSKYVTKSTARAFLDAHITTNC